MYTGLLHLHSILRWVIIILFVVAIFKSITGKNSVFGSSHKKISLFLMIACDIILLLGLYQWFAGSWGLKNIQNLGMKEVMGNSVYRFFAVEHLLGMLIAIILVHIGRGFTKKAIPDAQKHKKVVLFYTIAFIIVLASIPWPFREAGRALLPGM